MPLTFEKYSHYAKGMQPSDLEVGLKDLNASSTIEVDHKFLSDENNEEVHDAVQGSSHYQRSILLNPVSSLAEKKQRLKKNKKNGFITRGTRAVIPKPKERVPYIFINQAYSLNTGFYTSNTGINQGY